MDFKDTEQAPYTAPTQIPDQAVQAAVDRIQKVWLKGELISDEELAIAALTAAAPYLTASVEVRELEWVAAPNEAGKDGLWFVSVDFLGRKREVIKSYHGQKGEGWSFNDDWCPSLDQAKAAAQADYSSRILSQIVTKPFDVASALLDTQITENVISFLVSHDMIDESDEYSLQDIMAALYDNYTPNKPVDVAAVRKQAFEEAAQVAKHFAEHSAIEGMSQEIVMAQSYIAYDVATAIRALSPADPVDQWQDIATAPKDGTEFYTWNGRRQHVARFDKVENEWVSSFATVTKRLPLSPQPTHWMPLPTAPTGKGGE